MGKEIWKHLDGYENKIMVSSNGCVKSKMVGDKWRKVGSKMTTGYMTFSMGRKKSMLVHRAVAIMFIPNTNNHPQVNHKNGKRDDNRIENLEWCNNSENNKHAFDVLGRLPTWKGKTGELFYKTKEINQYDMNGLFIKKWCNAREITRVLGINYKNISSVCYKRRKSAGGFIWEFNS
jgi:hypothetical protein